MVWHSWSLTWFNVWRVAVKHVPEHIVSLRTLMVIHNNRGNTSSWRDSRDSLTFPRKRGSCSITLQGWTRVMDCVWEDFDQPISHSSNVLDDRWHDITTHLLRFVRSCDNDFTDTDENLYRMSQKRFKKSLSLQEYSWITQNNDRSDLVVGPLEHCRATTFGELFALTFIKRDEKWIRKHFRSGRKFVCSFCENTVLNHFAIKAFCTLRNNNWIQLLFRKVQNVFVVKLVKHCALTNLHFPEQ